MGNFLGTSAFQRVKLVLFQNLMTWLWLGVGGTEQENLEVRG